MRGLPFFLLGIWLGFGDRDVPRIYIAAISIFFALTLVFYSFLVLHPKGWLSYASRWWIGVIVFVSLFLAGLFLGFLSDQRLSSRHFSHFEKEAMMIRITESPVKKTSSFRSVGEVLACKSNGAWRRTSGKLLIYFPQCSHESLPEIGDRVMVLDSGKVLQPSPNPGQFDFKSWLERKQIYSSVYLKEGNWFQLPSPARKDWDYKVAAARAGLMSAFYRAGLRGNEAGVVGALVVGDDAEVDTELMHAFSASGTLHILSVSGMHVALIYGVLAAILGVVFRKEKYRWWKLCFAIISLWLYAILTGLSPAVQRAAAMLSLVVIGKTVSRVADTWNLLAGSLLLLVAIQPSLLLESGFQLSYAAVAGIVGFYPWLYQRVVPSGRVGDWLWKGVCVALSAQLFTFPLGLFYFHQFPNYFLPANLLIIPLSTLVMFGGIALLICSPFSFLFDLLAQPVRWSVQGLNRTVYLVGELPHAQITGVWITPLECALLSACIVSATFFLVQRKNSFLRIAFLLFSAFQFSQIVNYYVQSNRILWIRWKLSERVVADSILYGNRCVTWSDKLLHEKSMKTIAHGLDALHIAPEQRGFTLREQSTVSRQSVLPVICKNNYLYLPDTAIALNNKSRQAGIIRVR